LPVVGGKIITYDMRLIAAPATQSLIMASIAYVRDSVACRGIEIATKRREKLTSLAGTPAMSSYAAVVTSVRATANGENHYLWHVVPTHGLRAAPIGVSIGACIVVTFVALMVA
jgi:hypothetical protein